MRKPVVDYTKLRLNNITSPEYRHLLWLLGWVWYFSMYFITERVPVEKCHVIHSVVDDIIPFNEYFLLVYCSWYLLLAGTLLYFVLYDPKSLVRIQKFLILTQICAVVIYIVWPSIQLLRPEVFPRENILTTLMAMVYKFDTPTGVCPSMHCAFSFAILSAWFKKDDAKTWWKIVLVIWVLLICASVCFVKQHSFTDVWTALILAVFVEAVLFGKYWIRRLRKEETE